MLQFMELKFFSLEIWGERVIVVQHFEGKLNYARRVQSQSSGDVVVSASAYHVLNFPNLLKNFMHRMHIGAKYAFMCEHFDRRFFSFCATTHWVFILIRVIATSEAYKTVKFTSFPEFCIRQFVGEKLFAQCVEYSKNKKQKKNRKRHGNML